jgi:hypothetical protein
MKSEEELRLGILLAKLDGLQPWRKSKDLQHCWNSFPYQQEAFKPGECGGGLQLWEGVNGSWVGYFMVICEKHASDQTKNVGERMKSNLEQALTRDSILTATKGVIEDSLAAKGKLLDEPFHIHCTIREFQNMKDFYGSKAFLLEITNTYLGRLARMATMSGGVPADQALATITSSKVEAIQYEVAEILHDFYVKKWGPVSDERVKELDKMIHEWQQDDVETLEALTNAINAVNN